MLHKENLGMQDNSLNAGEDGKFRRYGSRLKNPDKKQMFPLPPMSFSVPVAPYPGSLGYKSQVPRNNLKNTSLFHKNAKIGKYTDGDRPYMVSPDRRTRFQVETEEQLLLSEASQNFENQTSFAEKFTDDLINKELHEKIIPDLLIDTLKECYAGMPEEKSDVKNPRTLKPITESRYLPLETERALANQAQFSKEVVDEVVNKIVLEESYSIVKQVMSDSIKDFKSLNLQQAIFTEILDELTSESIHDLFHESRLEVINELIENAERNLRVADDDYLGIIEKAVLAKTAGESLLDGLLLDEMLKQLVAGEQVFADSLLKQISMDGMTLEILLALLIDIDLSIHNHQAAVAPVKKLHQRILTAVALDELLNELSLMLDEDMKDFDDLETGLSNLLVQHEKNVT